MFHSSVNETTIYLTEQVWVEESSLNLPKYPLNSFIYSSPFPSQVDIPDPGIRRALQADSLPSGPPEKTFIPILHALVPPNLLYQHLYYCLTVYLVTCKHVTCLQRMSHVTKNFLS